MIIFTLLLIFIVVFIVIRCTQRSRRLPPLPLGPKPFPYIGSLIPMLKNKPTFRWIHRMMEEMETKIICIRLGHVHVIAVSDPKIACEFLKDNDEIFASRPDCMSGYLTSDGYLNTSLVPMSDHWKNMRRIIATEIASASGHKWLQNKRGEEADNLLRFMYNRCESNVLVTEEVVNVRIIVQQYTSNIARKIMFGSSYFGKESADGGHGDEEIEHVESFFTILAYTYAFCVTDFFPYLRWITDFDGHERIIRSAIRTARKYQDPLIDERIQQWKDGVMTKKDDLLDVFINLEDPQLTPDHIKSQILDLMIATFDNTWNSIEWALAEMINEPRILEKAVHELDSLVGKDRLVQESDLVHLNYINACVKEALRLHPIAPFTLPRVASRNTTVAGCFIPKDSQVIVSRVGLGRNHEVWDDPLTFNPDRHMNGNKVVVLTSHNLHMLSFSTGRRGCPGVLLGTTIAVMLLSRLIQGFSWEMPPNEPRVVLEESLHNLWMA
ncbi:tryptophan N-monooxygenase CYP79A68-like [Bidens hawaiensis]|uniref:tryptophan N-monooxygenase CYP79A68-like n=1 Tax=Bidens hawaiensis TaxID=980011 RepID=UPI00404B0A4D